VAKTIEELFGHLHTSAAENVAEIDAVKAKLDNMSQDVVDAICTRLGVEVQDKESLATLVTAIGQGAQILKEFGLLSVL